VIRIGIIGYGYWGPNLGRAVAECDHARLHAIADHDPDARAKAERRHVSARVVNDWRDVVSDSEVDAVLVATPVSTHHDVAMAALKAGKHVLVEKPLTDSTVSASSLVDEAARRSRILMVDHTFIYTGAVQAIYGMITNGELGDIYYYDSTRINLGLFQHDVNVIWDLAVHDFAIMDRLLPSRPVAITANAARCVPGSHENMAHISIYFDDGAMGHLNVNWLAPVKVRQTMIGGSKKMVIYDDMQTSEKVKVYDRGIRSAAEPMEPYRHRFSYRLGDMLAPVISPKEALMTMIEHFVDCIQTSSRPLSDGLSGLRVVEMLEAATRSAAQRGRPIDIAAVAVV
jgi:predicted dehydrogenase